MWALAVAQNRTEQNRTARDAQPSSREALNSGKAPQGPATKWEMSD